MAVLIRVGSKKAILRHGVWLAANPTLEAMLNSQTASWIAQTGGPPLLDTDHENTVAQEIVRQLGGRVLKRVPSRDAPGFYAKLRQLRLDFPQPRSGRVSRRRS